MGIANAAQLEPIFKESVDPVMTKQFEEKVMLHKKFTRSPYKLNMRGLRVDVQDTPSSSWNNYDEGGALADPDSETYLETKVFTKRASTGFSFTGDWLDSVDNEESLVKGLTKHISKKTATAMKKMDQQAAGDGTGELAVVLTNDSGTTATMTTTYAGGSLFGARKLQKRGIYNFVSSGGTLRTTGITHCTLVSKVESTGACVFDGVPTDAVATDIVVYKGSYNKAPTGLKALISSSGVIQGRSRTVDTILKADEFDNLGRDISTPLLVQRKNAMRYRSDEEPTFQLLSSYTQYEQYSKVFYNRLRFTPGGALNEAPGEKVKFDNHEWEQSPDIEDDRIYGDNWDDFAVAFMREFGRFNDDGQDIRMDQTGLAANENYVGWLGWKGNYFGRRFNGSFVIKNNSVTGAATGFSSVF